MNNTPSLLCRECRIPAGQLRSYFFKSVRHKRSVGTNTSATDLVIKCTQGLQCAQPIRRNLADAELALFFFFVSILNDVGRDQDGPP